MVTRLFSCDLLIADVIIPVNEENAASQVGELLREYQAQGKLLPGGKMTISAEEYMRFASIVNLPSRAFYPGGSSANVLVTLRGITGDNVHVDFLGIAGSDASDKAIMDAFATAGVKALSPYLPANSYPQSAISFVFVQGRGTRTIATYPGNAKQLFGPEMISDAQVSRSDIIFVQGSLWRKLHRACADQLMHLCAKHGKALWLAMPTQAEFGATPQSRSDKAQHFIWLIRNATLVLGNGEELRSVFHQGEQLADALEHLQTEFTQSSQLGFITLGEEGGAVVTREGIRRVPIASVDKARIVNTLGAGDTAFGAFGAAYLALGGSERDLTLDEAEDCAHFAMAIAAQKLYEPQARLSHPQQALAVVAQGENAAGKIARLLL